MARSEMYKEGRTPLHTFRADIDYCHACLLYTSGQSAAPNKNIILRKNEQSKTKKTCDPSGSGI